MCLDLEPPSFRISRILLSLLAFYRHAFLMAELFHVWNALSRGMDGLIITEKPYLMIAMPQGHILKLQPLAII